MIDTAARDPRNDERSERSCGCALHSAMHPVTPESLTASASHQPFTPRRRNVAQRTGDPIRRMRIETITSDGAFAALRPAWDAIADRIDAQSIFFRYDWFAAAWAWRRHDAELRILIAREGEAVAAILPLISVRSRGWRRVWTLLTVPDTQCCDLIAVAEVADAASQAFASDIASRRDWDVLMLDYLAPNGLIPNHLVPRLQQHRVHCVVEARGRNLCIPLGGRWDAYWATRSRSLKKACNLAANRLQKVGAVRIEHVGPGAMTDRECERATQAAIDISARSWKKPTGNSLDHPGPGGFIRCLSNAARAEGWLSIWLAYVDERPVAMEYQLVYRGAVHALRSDFDASLEHVSPGSYLFRYLLEHMFDNRVSLYLMGPGDNAYKARWTSDGKPLCRTWSYNRTFAGRSAHWIDQLAKPALRPLWHRLRGERSAGAGERSGGAT